jgi:hypothetical protein
VVLEVVHQQSMGAVQLQRYSRPVEELLVLSEFVLGVLMRLFLGLLLLNLALLQSMAFVVVLL